MLSIIIPSHKEPYLLDTIRSIEENSNGKVQIIINIDDGKPIKLKKEAGKNIEIIINYPPSSLGMRGGINWALSKARGKYVMKCDAHCAFGKYFDKILTQNMDDDWLVVPRRYSLWADGWKKDDRFPPKDYHYLCYPTKTKFYGAAMFPLEWAQRARERSDYKIDETMIMQGSCYVANRKYFMERVGYLNASENCYSPFGGEQIEVGLKYWLSGGSIKVNKNTWYAHLFKNSRYYKEVADSDCWHYKIKIKSKSGWEWAAKHWLTNQEPNMIHKFSWLVEKFWPVPSWPEDRSLWTIQK